MTPNVTDCSEESLTMQPQSSSGAGMFKTPDGRTVEIRDVWASNLDAEMEIIRELILKYNYVAMVSLHWYKLAIGIY